MMRALLLTLLVLVGCADVERSTVPFTVRLDPSATREQREAVQAAALTWNKSVGHVVFWFGEDQPGGACSFVDVELRDTPLVQRPEYIRPVLAWVQHEDCGHTLALGTEALKDPSTIAHELGHVLDLRDSKDPASVMFLVNGPAQSITEVDVHAVRTRWDL